FGHYYFGDWYARSYLTVGITPWFQYSARSYDPLWVHARWVNRGNTGWAVGVQGAYIARVNGTAPLPARTVTAQPLSVGANIGGLQLVYSMTQIKQSGVKLEPVSAQQHAAQLQSARQMTAASQQTGRSAGAGATPFSQPNGSTFRPPSSTATNV